MSSLKYYSFKWTFTCRAELHCVESLSGCSLKASSCVCVLHCPTTSEHVLLHLHPISSQRLGQLVGKIIRACIIIRKEASWSMTIGLHKSNRSFGDVCSWTSTLSWRNRYPPPTEDQTISMSYWFHSRGCHFSSSESSVSHMKRGNAGRTGGVLSCLLARQLNIIFQKNVGAWIRSEKSLSYLIPTDFQS